MCNFTCDKTSFDMVLFATAESEVPTQAAQSDSQTTANVIFEGKAIICCVKVSTESKHAHCTTARSRVKPVQPRLHN